MVSRLDFHPLTLRSRLSAAESGPVWQLQLLSILLGYYHLRTFTGRFLLVIAAIPVCILKNALRMFSIIMIYLYIDKSIISGPLHSSGGLLFFLIGLALLYPVAWALRQLEKKRAKAS